MTVQPPRNLFEKQVDLTRAVIALHMHIATQVMPHLDSDARDVVQDLLEHMPEGGGAHAKTTVKRRRVSRCAPWQ